MRISDWSSDVCSSDLKVPALSRWCPVAATSAWVDAVDLHEGPLFRAVDQWAGIATTPLHPNSLVRLLRRIFREAGLASPDDYSSHSLRRGFAGWANANGWDVKALMEYVGWRDVNSAMRYLDGADRSEEHTSELQSLMR